MSITSNETQTHLGNGHREGRMTHEIEARTAKIPSGVFLTAAGAATALSLGYKMMGRDKTANFIGLWVPSILLLGLYNKIAKLLR